MDDSISRQAAIGLVNDHTFYDDYDDTDKDCLIDGLRSLPPAQPQYEELTPEEAASEIASGSTMSAWYWLDDMIRLKQMGYAICRKK